MFLQNKTNPLTKKEKLVLTKCINHWADSANFKGVTFNKNCSGLTRKCLEMPNASYTNRWNTFSEKLTKRAPQLRCSRYFGACIPSTC